MELTKQSISAIRLQGKKGKYYYCAEVDDLLDEIGIAAGRLNDRLARAEQAARGREQLTSLLSAKDAEIGRMNEELVRRNQEISIRDNEIYRLQEIEAEYQDKSLNIDNILQSTNEITLALVEKRQKEYEEAFIVLESQKEALEEEINTMVIRKEALLTELRDELELLTQYLDSIQGNVAPIKHSDEHEQYEEYVQYEQIEESNPIEQFSAIAPGYEVDHVTQ